jgi:predicted PurR-regulated permease PerM
MDRHRVAAGMSAEAERASASSAQSNRPSWPRVDPRLDRAAAYSWRLLVVAAAVVAALWLTGRLLVVVLPIFVALLIARVLFPLAGWMRARGLPKSLAAVLAMLGFLLALAALVAVVSTSLAGEIDDLGPTLSQAVDDVEDWIVDDSPFDVDRARIDQLRDQAGERLSDLFSSSGANLTETAATAAEVFAGSLLALIITFFILKDHERFAGAALRAVRADRRPEARALWLRTWATLGGYLRGVAILGIVEGAIIGVAVWAVGGSLVAAVVVITLLGAFVPIVGAVTAGVIAVLVTLVTAGVTPAIIVAVVALVVQQLDNDLLAPWIYGKSLQLHPLVILLGITAGTALFGFVGTVLAVPVIAVVLNVVDEHRHPQLARDTDTDTDTVPSADG